MSKENDEHILYSNFTFLYELVFKPFFFPAIKKTMDLIKEEQPQKILEVGIGTGYSLEHYPSGVHVTGVDISNKMVEVSKKKTLDIVDKDFEILQTDGENLPFNENSFDLVVSFSVITVVNSPQDFLNQIRKVLKPNQKAVLIMHSRSSGFLGLIDRFWELPCKFLFGFTLLRHIEDLNLDGWQVLNHKVASTILGYPYNHQIVLKKV